MSSNLPPGVTTNMLPGNRPEDEWSDECWERAEDIVEGNEGKEELARWKDAYQEHSEASRDVPQLPDRDELVEFVAEALEGIGPPEPVSGYDTLEERDMDREKG